MGPFDKPPIESLHTSPFITRGKPGSDSGRVIIDLSYPQGEAVNAGVAGDTYLGSQFMRTLPSIEYITHKVRELGKGSLIYKIDISSTFRHIKFAPADYNLLGLHFNSNYISICLCQVNPSQADKSFEALNSLLAELGLDIRAKKLIHPTTRASY